MVDGVGMLRVTGRVGGGGAGLRVDMALHGGGSAGDPFDACKQHKKTGTAADDAGENPVGHGGNAPSLQQILNAPDADGQNGAVGQSNEKNRKGNICISANTQRGENRKEDVQENGCQQHHLPPALAFGREKRSLFPRSCPGFPQPAEVGDQVRCDVNPKDAPEQNAGKCKRVGQQINRVAGSAPDGKPNLQQAAAQQDCIGRNQRFFHGGVDIFHLHHRVCLNGDGMRIGIAEDLHDAPAGGQFPPGGAAHLPEVLLLLQGGGVQIGSLLKIHHRVPHFRGRTAAVCPELAADVLQLPALPGHVLQMAGHTAEIIVGIEIESSFFLFHCSISPLRPM